MGKHYLLFFAFSFVVSVQAARHTSSIDDEQLLQFSGGNATRRELSECAANNMIDKCWRCKPDWDKNRQALAKCAAGFAKGTTGGSGGEIYVVTDCTDADPANPKKGTLRAGVTQNKPVWITFEKDMVIALTQELVITSDTTIDGRGAKVEITGGSLSLYKVKNVIIHGLHIHDTKVTPGGMIKNSDGPPGMRHKTDGDGICVTGSSKIWIDHCSLSKGPDGLIDVTLGSTAVTISNCKFNHHHKVILLGADNSHQEDKAMQATVAFNLFGEGCDQRMPRCRFGFFQVVNNNYEGWGTYAVGGSAAPTILSQGNRYKAPDDPIKKNVLVRADAPEEEWKKWNWRSEKDVLLNGAIFIPSGVDPPLTPEQKELMIVAEPGESVPQLTSCAGALSCVPGKPCRLDETETIIADTEDYPDKHANAIEMEAYPELFASLMDKASTRRDLHECGEKNIIDRCWRCKADWAENRQSLTECVTGFAKGTTGGAGGEIYTVTSCADDNAENPTPGTLRYGVTQNKPLWIIFEKDMLITLKHTLVVSSDKTIDGRGAKVEIAHGGGITIHGVKNVIVHGINIHDVKEMPGFGSRSGCDGDAIGVKSSSKVWIDHCTLSNGPDGLVDVTVGSTGVTISNCKFHHHDKAILLGADDAHKEDKNMHVTVAFNRFEGVGQRMPRCRFGFFQVVNNDIRGWGIYAIGGSSNPTILSQGNRFHAPNEAHLKQVTVRANAKEEEWKKWNWRSEKDLFENGAFFVPSGSDPQLTQEQQQHMIEVAPGSDVPHLTKCAGVLSCVPGHPCN
ncbi:hypothetical protein R6Q59_005335 [Mikania micrantha]